jgi:hypothetical protein
VIFDGTWFVMSFFFNVWACTSIFIFHYGCTHLRCYITSDVHLIMRKEISQRIFALKNEKCIILLNVVPMYFF